MCQIHAIYTFAGCEDGATTPVFSSNDPAVGYGNCLIAADAGRAKPVQVVKSGKRGEQPMIWIPRALAILLAALLVPRAAEAQEGADFTVHDVTFSASYYSQRFPGNFATLDEVFQGGSKSVTAATNIGWTYSSTDFLMNVGSTSLLGVRLDPNSRPRNWNESVSAALSGKLSRRWLGSVGANAAVMNFDESLFATPEVQRIAATGANHVELASAVLKNETTDPQLLNIGGFNPDLTQQRFLFGRRMAYSGVDGGVAYKATPRLMYSASASVGTIRHLDHPADDIDFTAARAVTLGVGAGVRYSLSPRTELAFDVNLRRGGHAFDGFDSSGLSAHVTLSKTLRRWWFFEVSGGGAAEDANPGTNQSFVYSGAVGLKTSSQTLMASYGHSIDDPYVVAIGSGLYADALTAGWYWDPPRSNWAVSASYADGRSHFLGLTTVVTTAVAGTVTRHIGENFGVSGQYSTSRVGSKRYVIEGRRYQLDQTGVRASFQWFPGGNRRRQ